MYKLVVIFDKDDREVFAYHSREIAERTMVEMKKVFGNQIVNAYVYLEPVK